MDRELFDVGLEARKRVLGEEYVTRAFATADSFNIEFQQLVTEYCWGAVWGRSGLTDRQRSLNNLCLLAALNRSEEFKTHFRGALRNGCTPRRAARHAHPDHHLRRGPGRRRGLQARPAGARSRGHHAGAGAVTSTPTPSVLGFVGLGNMGRPMATRIASCRTRGRVLRRGWHRRSSAAGRWRGEERRGRGGHRRHDLRERARRQGEPRHRA